MKKTWIVTILALSLAVGTSLKAPSYAWPFGKKDKAGTEEVNQSSAEPEKSSKKDKKAHKDNATQEEPASNAASTESSATEPADKGETVLQMPKVQVSSPLSDEANGLKVEDPVESPVLPPEKTFVAVDDPKNPLGITVSAKKLNESSQLISQKKYVEAEKMLNPLKDWLIEATEAHINLHKTLKGLPSAQVQAELEKQLALQFALLRDKAFFQLGMLSIGKEDYSMAVKNLSRVIQSQPRSPMGVQAYDVLQKIGFTEKLQLREEKKGS